VKEEGSLLALERTFKQAQEGDLNKKKFVVFNKFAIFVTMHFVMILNIMIRCEEYNQ
jgi:hypothetical protein